MVADNIDPRIFAKIKKCLALASSDNPNEAATAMRQARVLMEKHGVSINEITMSDIGEATVESRTMARDKSARWEMYLAAVVGKAFGCQMMVERMIWSEGSGHINQGSYIYVGLKQQTEIASYAATVLIRRCKAARQKWLSDNWAGCGKGIPGAKRKMTGMGDAFAEGWVAAIGKLVTDFANPPEVEVAIRQHIETRSPGNTAPMHNRAGNGMRERAAAAAGVMAAKGESLYRPMDGAAETRVLGCVNRDGGAGDRR